MASRDLLLWHLDRDRSLVSQTLSPRPHGRLMRRDCNQWPSEGYEANKQANIQG